MCFFRLSNTVAEPVNALAEFAEQVGEGDFEARLVEDGDDDFGYIALQLNQAAEKAAKAMQDEEAQRNLQRSVTEFLTVVSQIARGDLTLRGSRDQRRAGQCGGLGQLHAGQLYLGAAPGARCRQ